MEELQTNVMCRLTEDNRFLEKQIIKTSHRSFNPELQYESSSNSLSGPILKKTHGTGILVEQFQTLCADAIDLDLRTINIERRGAASIEGRVFFAGSPGAPD